jgi:hypothetical protein
VNRNDLYSMLSAPDVRTLQGIVTRVSGTKVFVTCPGYDGNAEFGPVFYNGVTPTDGATCLVCVVNNTTEAWIVSWDGANTGLAPAMIMMNAIPVGNPGAAAWRLQSYNTFDNQAPSMFTPLAGPGPFTYGWVRIEQSGYYRVTANWMADRATSAEMTLAIQSLGVNGVISRQESYFAFVGPSPGWAEGMTGVCELFLPAGTGIGNQVYYDTPLNPQYCSFVVERLGGVVGPPGPAGAPGVGGLALACKAVNLGAQAAPTIATWTQVQFSGLAFNYGGFGLVGHQIVVPSAGLYRIAGSQRVVANSQTFIGALVYNYSGSGTGHTWPDGTFAEDYSGATLSNGVSYPAVYPTTMVELAAGSTIGMEQYQGTAGPQPGVAGANHLIVEKLR